MVVLTAVLTLASCATSQQRAERRQQLAHQVERAVSSRQLKIEVTTMSTQRYGSHMVTPDFFVAMRGDTLESYLPFFGRAYALPYGSPSQGLNFTSLIKGYRQSALKHNGMRMELEVASQEDRYRYQIDVYPNGKAYIRVQGQERDAVSFDGELVF